MAIALDASATSIYEASLSTYGYSHTCSGSNRLLIVGVAIFAAGSVTSITYNGVNLTKIRNDTQGVYNSELWYLVAPATGTNTVTVTLNASLTSIAVSVSFTGVAQTGSISSNAASTGSGAICQNNITTIEANDWCISVIATGAPIITCTSGTQDRNTAGVLGTGAISHLGPVASPSSNALSWDLGGTNSYTMSGAALKPLVVGTLIRVQLTGGLHERRGGIHG
jgi:hypothetical protein